MATWTTINSKKQCVSIELNAEVFFTLFCCAMLWKFYWYFMLIFLNIFMCESILFPFSLHKTWYSKLFWFSSTMNVLHLVTWICTSTSEKDFYDEKVVVMSSLIELERSVCWTRYLEILNTHGHCWHLPCLGLKGTLPRKSTWALNVDFFMKVTMVPFIWL